MRNIAPFPSMVTSLTMGGNALGPYQKLSGVENENVPANNTTVQGMALVLASRRA